MPHSTKQDAPRSPTLVTGPSSSTRGFIRAVTPPITPPTTPVLDGDDESKTVSPDDVVVGIEDEEPVVTQIPAHIRKEVAKEAARAKKAETRAAYKEACSRLATFLEECNVYLEETIKCDPYKTYHATLCDVCDDEAKTDETRFSDIPNECKIQFSSYNDKPSKTRRQPTHFVGSGRLLDPEDHPDDNRRARVIAFRFKGLDVMGRAMFDYGAVVYKPPVEHVKKYDKTVGFVRPALPRIPKALVPGHRLTAAKRCMDAPISITVPFEEFSWSRPCLNKVRKAIHSAMSKPGGCGGYAGDTFSMV